MKRRTLLFAITITSAALLAGSAFGLTFAEDVVGQLTNQGFRDIQIETTWLGRVRIMATRDDGRREIILNPRTGEVLRDSWQAAGSGGVMPIIDDVSDAGRTRTESGSGDNSGSGSAGSGDDHSSGDHSAGNDDSGGRRDDDKNHGKDGKDD